MKQTELIPHLFRTEFSKIISVLCKQFGIDHMEVAEDIASETFLTAMESWPYRGIPENPVAWLYTVAKNKTKNYIHRNQIFLNKIAAKVKSADQTEERDLDLSEKNISDSQLQMLFTICHPAIPTEAQISLALRILGGFGIDEIAHAFLTNKETVNKRLFRAKEKLRLEKVVVEVPSQTEINNRLNTVLTTLYLLFNEGYYSETNNEVIRQDLCLEAMRLTHLLLSNRETNTPRMNALMALMCFHASRFAARKNEFGDIVLYQDQDEKLWNAELITKGTYYLSQASIGNDLSKYHLEASIAYWHTHKADTREKWDNILQLFNMLLQIEYSPVAALNRTYALSKVAGQAEAIKQAEKLELITNPYYYTLLGELYQDIDKAKAEINFRRAHTLAKTLADKKTIAVRIQKLAEVSK